MSECNKLYVQSLWRFVEVTPEIDVCNALDVKEIIPIRAGFKHLRRLRKG